MAKHQATATKEPAADPSFEIPPKPAAGGSTPLATQDDGGMPVIGEYEGDAGAGMENVSQDEILIPILRVLQALSPQVDETTGIHGARPGMIFNTATGEVFDGKLGIGFIPALRDHNFVEYTPREKGGGFIAIWDAQSPAVAELRKKQGQFGKLVLENGNELSETRYLYGLALLPNGDVLQAVVAFASTQIKKYKAVTSRLMQLVGQPKPTYPIYAFRWKFATVPEKNKKGSFYGWRCDIDGATKEAALIPARDPLFLQAREFHIMLKEGQAKADLGAAATAGAEDSNTGNDTDIPM